MAFDRFLNRRMFLQLSGMSLALTVAGPGMAGALGDRRRRFDRVPDVSNEPTDQLQTPTLVTVFLRGGADGLNIAIPTDAAEYATYQTYRPTLQVPLSAMQAAGTALTDAGGASVNWGLHPSAAALGDLWRSGHLVVLPDVHYDNGSRSHFDSQQFYENGTPFLKFTPDGWANRHLATSGSGSPLLRAVTFDTQTPFAFAGPYPTLTFSDLSDLSVSSNSGRNGRYLNTQEAVYPTMAAGPKEYDPEVAQAGSDLVAAIRWIESVSPLPATDPAADYPIAPAPAPDNGRHAYFAARFRDLAKLIKSNAFTIEMAQVDLHGWDTHQGQGGTTGYMPGLIEALSRTLKAFLDDVGDAHARRIVVQVFSEFGRTSRENGTLGTDHGSATVAFVLGHPSVIAGRRIVHGPAGWAGLSNLRENRDLRHSTDYRSMIAEIVARHLGNSSPSLFPDFTPTPVGLFA